MSAISDFDEFALLDEIELNLGLGEQFLDPAGRAAPRTRRAASPQRRRRPCVRGPAAGSALLRLRSRRGWRAAARRSVRLRLPMMSALSSTCMIAVTRSRRSSGLASIPLRDEIGLRPPRRRSWRVRRGSARPPLGPDLGCQARDQLFRARRQQIFYRVATSVGTGARRGDARRGLGRRRTTAAAAAAAGGGRLDRAAARRQLRRCARRGRLSLSTASETGLP